MKIGSDKSVPSSRCTNCGYEMDCCSNVSENDDAAFTICIHCGHVMAFAGDLMLRNLTGDEFFKIAADPRLLAIQRALGAMKKS